VVGEDERWRCGGRALGTSGRTARTCGRVAGEGGMAHEPVSSAVGRHGARADEVGGAAESGVATRAQARDLG
jgi:hypothetical protein